MPESPAQRKMGSSITRILFVCHGNICRSPMAEYVLKEFVRRKGLEDVFEIDSAATSSEELGNPLYPPAQRVLQSHGIPFGKRRARRFRKEEYSSWDLIVCMDRNNVRNLSFITPDPEEKVRLLMDFAGEEGREVADPWWTGNFDATWEDVLAGCRGLLDFLLKEGSGKE